ncbi:hypothetical protein EV700_2841 [Fluviicoccus keumensis]|uniref:Uncharacterized protein n=1 Tax=Fluviicoccus keumensis TaxID=1435465 RepID=A0A4Q7YKQ8_9GAMM|nr:hypothetical protein [Fluviicoccus keumensis]RZU38262.1 hypothetical protein EV700_2841 [Fluviicoccus keumensis]
MTTITLRDVDPRTIHRQITQLEAMQQQMSKDAGADTEAMKETLRLLHQIEETIRHDAREAHHMPHH